MSLINVGSESSINRKMIVAINSADSNPIKKSINNARAMGMLIDMTGGKKTGSVIFMESGHVILAINKPGTLKDRVNEL